MSSDVTPPVSRWLFHVRSAQRDIDSRRERIATHEKHIAEWRKLIADAEVCILTQREHLAVVEAMAAFLTDQADATKAAEAEQQRGEAGR